MLPKLSRVLKETKTFRLWKAMQPRYSKELYILHRPVFFVSSIQHVSATVLAVDGGARLFPGRGGAYDEPAAPSPAELIIEAANEIEEDVSSMMNVVADATGHAVRVREAIEEAGERLHERVTRMAKSRRRGWKSRAFDLRAQ